MFQNTSFLQKKDNTFSLKERSVAFTLIELLIVIAIIAILAAAVIIAINPGEQLAKARDATRERHVKALESALYVYYYDHLHFPSIPEGFTEICDTQKENYNCEGLVDLSSLTPTYMASIPKDPRGGVNENGTGYKVATKENERVVLFALNAEETEVITGEVVNYINHPIITEEPGVGVIPTGWIIRDSNYEYGTVEYGISNKGKFDAKSVYSIVESSNWQNRWDIYWTIEDFDPNKEYIFGVWAKVDTLVGNPYLRLNYQGSDSEGNRVDHHENVYFTKENEWEFMSTSRKPIDFGAETLATFMKIYPYASDYGGGLTYHLSYPRME